jgi:hypothetical protein
LTFIINSSIIGTEDKPMGKPRPVRDAEWKAASALRRRAAALAVFNTLTPEQKELRRINTSKATKAAMESISPEQKAEMSRKQSTHYAKLSEVDKMQRREANSIAVKKAHANMSPEEKEHYLAWRSRLSPEEKALWAANRGAGIHSNWESKTEEEKATITSRRAAWHQEKSPEELATIYAKIGAANSGPRTSEAELFSDEEKSTRQTGVRVGPYQGREDYSEKSIRGGHSFNGSSAFREMVKSRDLNKCTVCGVNEDLHVHHRLPWGRFEWLYRLHPEWYTLLEVGVTLCPSHHRVEDIRLAALDVREVVAEFEQLTGIRVPMIEG